MDQSQIESSHARPDQASGWPDRIHAILKRSGISQVGYVPDNGHARLISGADVAFIYRDRHAEEEATATKIRALGRRTLALKADVAGAPAVGRAVDHDSDRKARSRDRCLP